MCGQLSNTQNSIINNSNRAACTFTAPELIHLITESSHHLTTLIPSDHLHIPTP